MVIRAIDIDRAVNQRYKITNMTYEKQIFNISSKFYSNHNKVTPVNSIYFLLNYSITYINSLIFLILAHIFINKFIVKRKKNTNI